MKKSCLALTIAVIVAAFTVAPVLAVEKPVIKLERVEVATIQPFFVKPKIMVPSKEDPKKKVETVGKYGYSSTMNVAYILAITNPGKEPIMLDEISFTIEFEGFEVNTVNIYEDSWIPAGKTNYLRVIGTNEAFPTIVSLMLGAENVQKTKEMGTSAGALVGKWFKEIADFSFPISINNGMAVFEGPEGKPLRVPFSGTFGGEKAEEAKAEKAEKAEKKEK